MQDAILEENKNHFVDGLNLVTLKQLLSVYFLQLAETLEAKGNQAAFNLLQVMTF